MQEFYLIISSFASIILIFIISLIVGWATDSAERGMETAVILGFFGLHVLIWKAGWGWILFIEFVLVLGYFLFKLIDKYEAEIDAWRNKKEASNERKKKIDKHQKDVKEIRNMFDDL